MDSMFSIRRLAVRVGCSEDEARRSKKWKPEEEQPALATVEEQAVPGPMHDPAAVPPEEAPPAEPRAEQPPTG